MDQTLLFKTMVTENCQICPENKKFRLDQIRSKWTLHYVLDSVFVAPGAAGSAAKVAYTNCAL